MKTTIALILTSVCIATAQTPAPSPDAGPLWKKQSVIVITPPRRPGTPSINEMKEPFATFMRMLKRK